MTEKTINVSFRLFVFIIAMFHRASLSYATVLTAAAAIICDNYSKKRGTSKSWCDIYSTHSPSSGVAGACIVTPLVYLRSLSEETGCEIFAKCEFMNPTGSVKDRAAFNLIHEVTVGVLMW